MNSKERYKINEGKERKNKGIQKNERRNKQRERKIKQGRNEKK